MIAPGACTTVQDAGRTGYQALGVPRSGPLDRVAFELANALAGNGAGTPALEMLLQGPTLRVEAESVRVALVGCGARIETREAAAQEGEYAARVRDLAPGRTATLLRGEILRVGRLESVCAYLAVEGGVAVPRVLGSASTYLRGGFGGLAGRRLQARDVVALHQHRATPGPERALAAPFALRLDDPVRVVLGPQQDFFTAGAVRTFFTSEYTMTPQSDRMGYRLAGPPLAHAKGHDIVSDGIVIGSIQVPGTGQPVVLMVDNQTTGGYPKIATVISADVPLVARRRPGRAVRFVEVDVHEAERARREQETALDRERAAIVSLRGTGA